MPGGMLFGIAYCSLPHPPPPLLPSPPLGGFGLLRPSHGVAFQTSETNNLKFRKEMFLKKPTEDGKIDVSMCLAETFYQ